MTKLMEWLTALTILFSIWLSLVTNKIEIGFAKEHPTLLLYSPIICVILFGLYALAVVLYRVFTFNDCEEAAKELRQEIIEAKQDLAKRGFKFQE